MRAYEFEVFVSEIVREFRIQLREGWDMNEIKSWILRQFRFCTCDFEEQTLKENLAEVFQNWLEEIAA